MDYELRQDRAAAETVSNCLQALMIDAAARRRSHSNFITYAVKHCCGTRDRMHVTVNRQRRAQLTIVHLTTTQQFVLFRKFHRIVPIYIPQLPT